MKLKIIKRIFTAVTATALTLSLLCGCQGKKDDNSDKKSSAVTTTTAFMNNSQITAGVKVFETEIAENSFPMLTDLKASSDCSNEFFSVIYGKNTSGIKDGVYSSPNVKGFVNGKEKCYESLAYIIVSGEDVSLSVSFDGGYVKEGSDIEVVIENFNKLREPKDEDDNVGYGEYTDEVVFEGVLKIKSTAGKSFGNLRFDFKESEDSRLVVGNSSATLENAFGILGSEPKVEDIVLITKAGTEVKYDKLYKSPFYDEEGNELSEYVVTFCFADDKKHIDLGEIDDVKVCGKSMGV